MSLRLTTAALVLAFLLTGTAQGDVTQIVKRTGATVPLAPNGQNDAFAACVADERLVGGAALATGSPIGSFVKVTAPDPNTPRTWFARAVQHESDNPGTGSLTAYAYCASGNGTDRIRRVVERVGDPVGVPQFPAHADVFARCRPGEQLIGGGAGSVQTSPGVYLLFSAPDPNNTRRWFVRATQVVHPQPVNTLEAVALCAKSDGPDRIDRVRHSQNGPKVLPPFPDRRRVEADCGEGERVVGGGFLQTSPVGDLAYVNRTSPSTFGRSGWTVAAHGVESAQHETTAHAYCAR
jgi:hypothetical protein